MKFNRNYKHYKKGDDASKLSVAQRSILRHRGVIGVEKLEGQTSTSNSDKEPGTSDKEGT